MPVPITIPSTLKRIPLVKKLRPNTYNQSIPNYIDEDFIENSDFLSYGSIGNIYFRVNSALVVAARKLGLNPLISSFSTIQEEIDKKIIVTQTLSERNKVSEALYYLEEAKAIYLDLVDTVRNLANKDALKTKEQISYQITNPTIREQLIDIVNLLSRSGARR